MLSTLAIGLSGALVLGLAASLAVLVFDEDAAERNVRLIRERTEREAAF